MCITSGDARHFSFGWCLTVFRLMLDSRFGWSSRPSVRGAGRRKGSGIAPDTACFEATDLRSDRACLVLGLCGQGPVSRSRCDEPGRPEGVGPGV